MPLIGILFLSAALSAPAGQSLLLTHQAAVVQPETVTANVQTSELTPSQWASSDKNSVTPSDDVCYKIRAYIFRRDDDHAPQFVRSTTCGPRKPHTKDAAWPKARVVPAN